MMARRESFWHLLAQAGSLLIEHSHVIVADIADTFVGQKWLEHLQRLFKVAQRQILDNHRNMMLVHTRTRGVGLVNVRFRGHG